MNKRVTKDIQSLRPLPGTLTGLAESSSHPVVGADVGPSEIGAAQIGAMVVTAGYSPNDLAIPGEVLPVGTEAQAELLGRGPYTDVTAPRVYSPATPLTHRATPKGPEA